MGGTSRNGQYALCLFLVKKFMSMSSPSLKFCPETQIHKTQKSVLWHLCGQGSEALMGWLEGLGFMLCRLHLTSNLRNIGLHSSSLGKKTTTKKKRNKLSHICSCCYDSVVLCEQLGEEENEPATQEMKINCLFSKGKHLSGKSDHSTNVYTWKKTAHSLHNRCLSENHSPLL